MGNIDQQLEPYGYLRLPKSLLVHPRYLVKLSRTEAVLSTGGALPVSKQRYRAVLDALGRLSI